MTFWGVAGAVATVLAIPVSIGVALLLRQRKELSYYCSVNTSLLNVKVDSTIEDRCRFDLHPPAAQAYLHSVRSW